MASCVLRRTLLQTSAVCRRSLRKIGRRTLLSDAHCCPEAWRERLQTPILQKVDVGEFALRIQEKLDKGGVQSVDMDVLANKLESLDSQQLDFVQNLFYRFRHTNNTIRASDSMSHAIIRALVHFNETDRLLDILKDKINYGIFLDDFSANFLLDHFIKKENFYAAAQVAYDLMLQEDFTHPVVRHLAWYACDKHRRNPPPAPEVTEEATAEEDEDVWVPIKFIRHPWYDDHWDMNRDSLLLGKTLALIANHEEGVLGTSYRLMGLGLWEKFDKAVSMMNEWAASADKPTVAQEAITSFMSTLEGVETKEAPEEETDAGTLTMDDVRPYITAQQKETLLQQSQEAISKLESQSQVVDEDLESLLSSKVRQTIKIIEPKDIEDQTTLYKKWIDERQALIQAQIDAIKNQEKREAIAMKLRELQDREEKLSYFEEKEKIMLGISRAPKFRPIEDVEEEEQFVAPPTERGRNF